MAVDGGVGGGLWMMDERLWIVVDGGGSTIYKDILSV